MSRKKSIYILAATQWPSWENGASTGFHFAKKGVGFEILFVFGIKMRFLGDSMAPCFTGLEPSFLEKLTPIFQGNICRDF
jgi:hypothetical protein